MVGETRITAGARRRGLAGVSSNDVELGGDDGRGRLCQRLEHDGGFAPVTDTPIDPGFAVTPGLDAHDLHFAICNAGRWDALGGCS
jgi:hypothetical protein